MKSGRDPRRGTGPTRDRPAGRHKHKVAIALLSVLAVAVIAVMIWAPDVANWIRAEAGSGGETPGNAGPAANVAFMAPSAAELKQGHQLYLRDCASCHGQNGDGVSHVSRTLHPQPFDLRSFEFAPSYIAHALQDGIPGTDMPAWHTYTTRQLRLVSAYTASLGRPDRLSVAERFAAPAVLAEAGKRVYTMHCVRCHGERGDGNGPEAEKHKPLPANFLQVRPSFALARHIIEDGVPGTDMQAWPLLTPGEVQAVTYYIRSFYAGPAPAMEDAQAPAQAEPERHRLQPSAWTALGQKSLPAGARGESILLGMRVFLETPQYAQLYVGNQLSCGDCHLQAGTAAYGVPLVGAPSWFPVFSQRAGHEISLKDRIQECFTRSENGHPLPYNGREMDGLVAFMGWLSEGKPPARPSTGRGLEKLPALRGNASRGEKLFTERCQGCHGSDGAGVPPIIPPLWGAGAYNAGAGMNRVPKMAAFVRRNMPQNHPGSLTAQQAYDVAAYVATKPHAKFNSAYAKY